MVMLVYCTISLKQTNKNFKLNGRTNHLGTLQCNTMSIRYYARAKT